jgi:phosphoglycerate dehydrogenase-like enzyme
MQRTFATIALPFVVTLASGAAALQAQTCPYCEDAAALIRQYQLTEAREAVRAREDWAPLEKIVTTGGEAWATALRAVVPAAEVIGVADAAAAVAVLRGAQAYVGSCSDAVVQAGTELRWIQLTSAGADRCAAAMKRANRDVLVTNAQALYGPPVADHALALILALARGLPAYSDYQRDSQWHEPNVDQPETSGNAWELNGTTVLIIGLGGIGTEIARRAHAFGMRVVGTRSSRRDPPPFVEYVGVPEEAATLAQSADVVISAVPLTPETRGMFDRTFFSGMKRSALFINVGRGETVITTDLVNALADGEIAGAGLDVVDPEPLPPDHSLWRTPNVIVTPHVAFLSDQARLRILALAVENARRYAGGARMLSVVDLSRGY